MSFPRTNVPKDQVMQPDKKGMVTDHYTGQKVRYSDAEKGHLLYYEHRYLSQAAAGMKMSTKDFHRMNKCSNILVPQERTNNRSGKYECKDDSIGFNTSLNLISNYLKYGKSQEEQKTIDKQVQKARLDYLREQRDKGRFDRDKNDSKKINTRTERTESLLTPENKLNYTKLDSYIARDKAREAKKAGNKDSPTKSIPVKSNCISGKEGGRSATDGGHGTGGKGSTGHGKGSTGHGTGHGGGGHSSGGHSTGGHSSGSTGGRSTGGHSSGGHSSGGHSSGSHGSGGHSSGGHSSGGHSSGGH